MTLHEFLAMCNAQGQMLKTNGMLCTKDNPFDCHLCFPESSPQDFFMRELFVKSFLKLVDLFICPSAFLRGRYVDWGLPPEKLIVLENGQSHAFAPEAEPPSPALRTRFVVLGQLSALKGTLVLLDAVQLLPLSVRQSIRIEIHGSVQYQTDEFKQKLAKTIKKLGDTVKYCGPYFRNDIGPLLRENGWVIVPSIWWENSPLVIQEAFSFGRPIICSNIGGMAEKVTDGVNGLHFSVGNAAALARRIEDAATTPGLWERLRSGVPVPPRIAEMTDEILVRYASLKKPATSAEASSRKKAART
jgi:glycosyltransferase involved in cell wall biosynthesis